MIDSTDATRIANEHVEAQPAPLEGYRIALGRMQPVTDGWYFDYRIQCDLDIPESEREMFGGAPGFKVSRDSGEVTVVSWDDLRSLGPP